MKKILLGIAVSSLLVTPVLAADTGIYVTGAGGAMRNMPLLNNAWSYSVLAGYRFLPNISAEAGYTSLAANTNQIGGLPNGASATVSLNGYELAGVYDYPLMSQLSVYGRGGFASMTISSDVTVAGNTTATSASESGLLFGAGVKYKVSNSFNVQAGFNAYFLSNNSGSDVPVTVSVATTYRF
jgi:opacity protein-like surface antigen